MGTGVEVYYGNFAVGAKESFEPITAYALFNTLGNLQKNNVTAVNYGNPCEYCNTLLDGSCVPVPDDTANSSIGFWSRDTDPFNQITIEFVSEKKFDLPYFTMTFDVERNIYPSASTLTLYSDDKEVAWFGDVEHPFGPVWTVKCGAKQVNRIVYTADTNGMNQTGNRLRIQSVDYGNGVVLTADKLRNVSIKESVDPISSELKIGTCNLSLDVDAEGESYPFSEWQQIKVSKDGELIQTAYITSATRNTETLYDISAENSVSKLDRAKFNGDVYSEKPAGEIIADIFKSVNIPYSVDDTVASQKLWGHIPITTARDALKQVAFATCSVVVVNADGSFSIKPHAESVSQSVPLDRILEGQKVQTETPPDVLKITVHNYAVGSENAKVLAEFSEFDVEKEVRVEFENPIRTFAVGKMVDDDFVYAPELATIKERSANHAVLSVWDKNAVILGIPYSYTTSEASETLNEVDDDETPSETSITEATLVSSYNVDEVLKNCAEYFKKSTSCAQKIIEDGEEARICVGDMISVETAWSGTKTGIVTEQSYSLSGNNIAKETVVK